MFLFFHDIGMPPLWILILWLIAFLACPVFFIKGVLALSLERRNSTFMYAFAVLFFIALVYNFLWIFLHADFNFFSFLTVPFGIGALPLLAIAGFPMFFVIILAVAVNFVALYGAVRTLEKLIDRLKKR